MKSSVLISLFLLGLCLSACEKDKSPTQPINPTTTPTAWVVNSSAGTLSKIDLTTGVVTNNVVTLGTFPNDIAIRDSVAYVVNSANNQIQVINLKDGQTLGPIEILQGQNPYSIVLDDNQKAYVSNELTGNVSRLDLTSNLEDTAVSAGISPEGVCVYQNKLYVTDTNFSLGPPITYGQGRVFVFSTTNMSAVDTIAVATNPQTIKVGPDGNLHVVCTGNYGSITGMIFIINPATLAVVDSLDIGGTPGSLVFNTQNIGYLGDGGWVTQGYVLSYNGLTHQILHSDPANPILVARGAYGVCATPDGHILVCCQFDDQVVELDENGANPHSYNVGDGPAAVAVSDF
jgi:hypothetical protein